MHGGFIHSVKVPRLYKSSAKVVRDIREKGGSLKSLIYEKKHPNVSGMYALSLNTLNKEEQLNFLLTETGILTKEPRLDPWLAKVLITELLWGKKALKTDCKPAQTILAYQKQLQQALFKLEVLPSPNTTVRKPRYVRVNTLLLSVENAISCFQDEGWSLLPECPNYMAHLAVVKTLTKPKFIQDFHIPELFVFPPDTSFHNHYGYQNGEIILQDKASCIPTQLLNPVPGSVVLDMCAAPGMKTTHLAMLMKNKGKIYAVELMEQRYETLCEQVKITNSTCVEIRNDDSMIIEAVDYPGVEYILVDPSCSGSGMAERQLVKDAKCSPQRLKQLQAVQVFLLRHALLNFPNVKRVVYSTCSIYPEENEQVIDEIIKDVRNAYTLVSIKDMFGENWNNYSSKKYKCSDKCLYANFESDMCNGFFVAVFERNFNVPLPTYNKRNGSQPIKKEPSDEMNQLDTVDSKKVGETRKRKKRGKKNTANKLQNNSKEESGLDGSSNSIQFLGEVQTNDKENNDEPPLKKKHVRKNKKQLNEEPHRANRKEVEVQKTKKQ
ncbi:nop2/Sun-like domain containing protein 5 [Colletes latitarsis]|uniref:nop2/Sun-like domain containing protein 5 n=1 Tax=Colletes latitarsis TaxID=2605962 RepID=UPI004036DCCD